MKSIIVVVVSIFSLLVFWQIVIFWRETRSLAVQSREAEQELKRTIETQRVRDRDAAYFADPRNYEKELRARFNYRLPGETMIILVPSSSPVSR